MGHGSRIILLVGWVIGGGKRRRRGVSVGGEGRGGGVGRRGGVKRIDRVGVGVWIGIGILGLWIVLLVVVGVIGVVHCEQGKFRR